MDQYADEVTEAIDYFGSIVEIERCHIIAARNLAIHRVRCLRGQLRILSSDEREMASDVMAGLSDLIRGMTDPEVVSGQRCLTATFYQNIAEVSEHINFVEYWFNQARLLQAG